MLGGIIKKEMQTKKRSQKYFNILLLTLSVSFGLYIIEIFDWLVAYELFIDIPLSLALLSSMVLLILVIIEIIKYRQFPNIVSVLIFIILTTTFSLVYANRNGMFYGKKVLDAAFLDDGSRMDLTLYENGKFIIFSNWLFGEERFEGSYKLLRDTIIFDKFPVIDNDFISKKIIINRSQKKIFFRKDKDGNYDKSFYYFQIDFKK